LRLELAKMRLNTFSVKRPVDKCTRSGKSWALKKGVKTKTINTTTNCGNKNLDDDDANASSPFSKQEF